MNSAVEGEVMQTTARTTKSLVYLIDARNGGDWLDDGSEDRWWTLCDPHGFCVGHSRRADAEYYMRHPEEWCDVCAATFVCAINDKLTYSTRPASKAKEGHADA